MASSRSRSSIYRKTKALLILSIVGFFLLLTYEYGFTINYKKKQVPVPVNIPALLDEIEILTLDDILICVKTSKKLAPTRLPIILKTWFQLAKEQTWFFTDGDSYELQDQTNGHMINTNCTSENKRDNVNCKMEEEIKYYMMTNKKWFCHFDDDDYVNIPRLLSLLQDYYSKRDWYLGKRSTFSPVKISCKYLNESKALLVHDIKFWFGTGGAGFCISRSLALKIYFVVVANGFEDICSVLTLPDDMCIGFLVDYVTKKKISLTHIPRFHSHIESMSKISVENLHKQISFSYFGNNTVTISGFNTTVDPTRFMSLHCYLFPSEEICKRP